MRLIFTIIVINLVIWQGSAYYDTDENAVAWFALGGVGLLTGLVSAAVISGIVQSFQMECRLFSKYIENKDAVFEDPDKAEPAFLGIMSGRWFLVLLQLVRDTWKGFFTEIQWHIRNPAGCPMKRLFMEGISIIRL